MAVHTHMKQHGIAVERPQGARCVTHLYARVDVLDSMKICNVETSRALHTPCREAMVMRASFSFTSSADDPKLLLSHRYEADAREVVDGFSSNREAMAMRGSFSFTSFAPL